MKSFLYIVVFLSSITMTNAKNISILFIGNSFTHMNNFSQMVSKIADEMNDTIYTDFSAFDSYTLEQHFSTNETIEKLNSYCWDYVVLQEQSQRPILDINTFNQKTLYYVESFLELIFNNYHNTQAMLFMTWGRQYGDKELCKKYNYTCSYESMQDMLIERYNLLGKTLNIPVVPCGIAWKYFSIDSTLPHYINLFHPDEKHPNVAGSFLNALIFYSAVTGKSTTGCKYNPASLTSNQLLELQYIAHDVLQTGYSFPNRN